MTNPCQGHAAESARAEHMKEAERLLGEYADARVDFLSNGTPGDIEARSALLAHIQRGAVPKGMPCEIIGADFSQKTVTVEMQCDRYEVRAGLHYLVPAAAPAPDQFRDAAKMMAEPAEVPMPECYVTSGGRDLFSEEQMSTYDDDREAAGYVRGLRDAVRDAAPLVQNGEVLVTVTGLTGSGKSAIAGEIEIMCRALGLEVEWGEGAAEKHLTHADWTNALEMYRPRVRIVEANIPRTAALRGEVK